MSNEFKKLLEDMNEGEVLLCEDKSTGNIICKDAVISSPDNVNNARFVPCFMMAFKGGNGETCVLIKKMI